MIWIDAFFRFSGIALLLVTGIIAIRDLPKSILLTLMLLTQLCLLSLFLGYAPAQFELPSGIRSYFRLMDVFLLSMAWLFVLALFQKEFRVRIFHVLVAGTIAGAMLMERLVNFGWVDGLPNWWAHMLNGSALMVVIHMIAVIVLGRKDDLLEKRRATRLYMVVIIISSAMLTIVLGSILLQQHQATVNVISLSPAIIAMSFWLLSIEKDAYSFKPGNESASNTFTARDKELKQKLEDAISRDQCHLEPNLSIESLASRLGVGVPRLREFINQKLGYNNFSTYINGFRIEVIKKALKDPQNEHIPILTLALNHGFNSLAPFNRAFKDQMGITPSAYRKAT